MASGKRTASNQLTHDNWDDEDTPEEAGFFKQADESELKGRVIKKAKRRGIASAEDNDDKPALFTGFKGFGIPAPQNASFSFNKKDGETGSSAIKFPSFGNSNGDAKPKISKNFTESTVDDVTEINKSKFLAGLKVLNSSMLKWLTSHTDTNPYCYFTPVFADYAKHLANLKEKYKFDDGSSSPSPERSTEPEDISSSNKSSAADSEAAKPVITPPKASAVITSPATFTFGSTKKVDPEPKMDDQPPSAPLFNFGTKPFEETKDKETPKPFSFLSKQSTSSDKSETGSTKTGSCVKDSESNKLAAATTPLFSFGKQSTESASTGSIFGPTSSTSGAFSFGFSQGSSKPAAAPTFTFGKSSGSSGDDKPAAKAASGFSFSSDVAKAKAAVSETTPAASNEDDEYVPPKPEVENVIKEDDALYTKRVKLFYNKDGKYVDKGVGNLFIKPLESGKNGLLIRADTNLGNILLNISLSESIPIKRLGKNNVTLVCVPNPPMEVTKGSQDPPPPTMLLIRVKETADANELCEKLNEYKQKL